MSKKLRIVFMGTPDFAVIPLRALLKGEHEVVAVYSQPPRPKGRGHKVQPSPVHEIAEKKGIPVFNPETFKQNPEAVQQLKDLKPDVAVVVAYGLILPKEVLDIPKHGCLNIHGSILPRWRGAAPIQRAIWEGDEVTGISIMQMDEGLDTGPVIETEYIDINDLSTAQSLHDKLSDLGAKMIVDVIDELSRKGQVKAKGQNNSEATYAHMLKKDDGRVNWNEFARQISQQIRALTPWPGVWTVTEDGKRIKIIMAEVTEKPFGEKNEGVPGEVLDTDGLVECGGTTVLKLVRVQPESSKEMDIVAAVNGGYLKTGMIFKSE